MGKGKIVWREYLGPPSCGKVRMLGNASRSSDQKRVLTDGTQSAAGWMLPCPLV